MFKGSSSEAAGGEKHRRRTLWGTLRIFSTENKAGGVFNIPSAFHGPGGQPAHNPSLTQSTTAINGRVATTDAATSSPQGMVNSP